MEALILLAFVGGWGLLAALALRFGHDSRDGIEVSPQGPLWRRPHEHGQIRLRRGRRSLNPVPDRVARIARLAPVASG
jgi:hypothetical protein